MIEKIIFFLAEHLWIIIYFVLGLMALGIGLAFIEKICSFINKKHKNYE